MIATILAFVGTKLGRIAVGVVAVLVFIGGFALDQRSRGRASVLADSKKEAQKINAKNAQVFDRAQRPGAAERVRKLYCRDC